MGQGEGWRLYPPGRTTRGSVAALALPIHHNTISRHCQYLLTPKWDSNGGVRFFGLSRAGLAGLGCSP